jgi:hypothetical protein
MALWSMILGIVAFPTMGCFGIGIILSVIALILGIISLVAINKNPAATGGKGFAIAGVVTGAFGTLMVPLLLAILIPSLGRARELANRTACAANLRGTVQAMLVYAGDSANQDTLPCSALGGPTWTNLSGDPTAASGNVAASLGILVVNGYSSPKSFICKSDPSISGAVATYNGSVTPPTVTLPVTQISYSVAVPWAPDPPRAQIRNAPIAPWWKNMTDASIPLMGDIAMSGPASGSNAAGKCSINHKCEGQTVGYSDAHIEWARNMTTGQLANTTKSPILPLSSDPAITTPYAPYWAGHKTTTGTISN